MTVMVDQHQATDIKDRLRSYPPRLAEARLRVWEARQELEEAKRLRDIVEADLIIEIASATDEKGRLRYSNQELRAAELLRRKVTDVPYQEANSAVRMAEQVLEQAQTEYQRLADEYQALKIIARLTIAEMALAAGCEIREV